MMDDQTRECEDRLREIALAEDVSVDEWGTWARRYAFTRDLHQLPMGDQDRVFRVVA